MSTKNPDPNRDKVREQVSVALDGFIDAFKNGEGSNTISFVREETGDVAVVAETAADAAVVTGPNNGSMDIDVQFKDEDDVDDDDDEDDECKFCHYSPCITQGEAAAEILEIAASSPVTNKQARFQLYQSFCREIFGVLGKGNRRQLPGCVVTLIQNMYPEEKPENYTGFSAGPNSAD